MRGFYSGCIIEMSGRLVLATTGIQGRWLTDDPNYSHFLMNFRRHTKFSFEGIDFPFERFDEFGNTATCRIPQKSGDLLRNVMVKIKLAPPTLDPITYTLNSYQINGATEIDLYQGVTYTFSGGASGDIISRTSGGSTEYTYPAVGTVISRINNDITFKVPYIEPPTPDDPEDAVPYKLYYTDTGSNSITLNIKTLRWDKSIATKIIKHIDLNIGGQLIQRLTGEYIWMYNQLHSSKRDIDFSVHTMTSHSIYPIITRQDFEFKVNVPFYFYRHPRLSIPVCALTKQQVEIKLETRPASGLVVDYNRDTEVAIAPPSGVQTVIKDISLLNDFAFILDDEKNFFMTRPLEYMASQLQLAEIKLEPGESSKSVMINFKNPVKELFFIAKTEDDDFQKIKNVNLKFNNQTVIDSDNLMLAYAQPMKHHTGSIDVDSEFGIHSFALKPESSEPTGQVNMSRIAHKLLNVELDNPNTTKSHTVRVYAMSYNILYIYGGIAGLKF